MTDPSLEHLLFCHLPDGMDTRTATRVAKRMAAALEGWVGPQAHAQAVEAAASQHETALEIQTVRCEAYGRQLDAQQDELSHLYSVREWYGSQMADLKGRLEALESALRALLRPCEEALRHLDPKRYGAYRRVNQNLTDAMAAAKALVDPGSEPPAPQ